MKMIEEYIKKKKYNLDAKKIFEICSARKWKNTQGNRYKRLEKVIDSFFLDPIKRDNAKPGLKKVDEVKNIPNKRFMPYQKQLLDPRWLKFRDIVLKQKGRKCQDCGSTKLLNIHHLDYKKDCYAWEYSIEDVVVVCKDCHKKRHGIDLDMQMDVVILLDSEMGEY